MATKQKRRTGKTKKFTYTKPQADEILTTLRKAGLPKNTNHTDLLIHITELVRKTLTGTAFEAELHTPAAKRVRSKIGRVTKEAEAWLASMEAVIPKAEYSSGGGLITYTNDPDTYHSTLMTLRALITHSTTWGKNTQVGRRKKGAVFSVVRSLAYIYFITTGRVPSRQYNDYTGKEGGTFRAFIHAVMEPTGLLVSPATVDHFIRQVIHECFPPKPPLVMEKNPPLF